jgi:hypothetical protein
MPVRIQRKRSRGWKAPAGAVYVGRPSKWGNPFIIHANSTAERAVAKFRDMYLDGTVRPGWASTASIEDIRHELRGKDLMCWCPLDQPCHADVLLEIANSTEAL